MENAALGTVPRSGIPMISTERSFTDAIRNMVKGVNAKLHILPRMKSKKCSSRRPTSYFLKGKRFLPTPKL